ncbi:MAG: metallophosphoesterase [bacterium]|nr:metallophosphoesterase [bacterium]
MTILKNFIKRHKLAVICAILVSAYSPAASLIFRNSTADDKLMSRYGLFPLLNVLISLPSICLLRLFGHEPSGYTGDSEIVWLFVLNLVFYLVFFTLLFKLPIFKPVIYRKGGTCAGTASGAGGASGTGGSVGSAGGTGSASGTGDASVALSASDGSVAVSSSSGAGGDVSVASGAKSSAPARMGCREAALSMGRRAFILGTSGAAIVAGGTVYFRRDAYNLEVTENKLTLKGCPATLAGKTVVLISDVHRGPYVSMEYLNKVSQAINALEPDIIVIAGDSVYLKPVFFDDACRFISSLKAKIGIFGTLGNHDHWEGASIARRKFPQAGLRLLDNDRVFIDAQGQVTDNVPAEGICLGGVGDLWEDKVDFEAACALAPRDMPRIVISHNPEAAELSTAGQCRIDVMLAGHMHGGQVALPVVGAILVPANYGNKYVSGWAQGPHFPVYVTNGIGMTVLPVRYGPRPEISRFVINAS